jgi:hypothetical protein
MRVNRTEVLVQLGCKLSFCIRRRKAAGYEKVDPELPHGGSRRQEEDSIGGIPLTDLQAHGRNTVKQEDMARPDGWARPRGTKRAIVERKLTLQPAEQQSIEIVKERANTSDVRMITTCMSRAPFIATEKVTIQLNMGGGEARRFEVLRKLPREVRLSER